MDAARRRAALAGSAAALALTACAPLGPRPSIASPPVDAGPEHVVQAFIDAVNAGDTSLVQQLSTDGTSQFEDWIDEGATMHDARILDLHTGPDQTAGTAHPGGVSVTVEFTPRGTDDSLPAGVPVTWGFLLTDDSGRWLVFDAGVG